jgi:hypothetical protein
LELDRVLNEALAAAAMNGLD